MRVLITQPAQEAAVSARALAARGHDPITIPLVSVERESAPNINLANAQGFLAISPEGVRALADHVGVRTFPIFVDSDLTAAEARRAGFKEVFAAKDDSQDLARLVERTLTPANGALIYACSTAAPVNLSAMLGNMGFAVRPLPLYSIQRMGEIPSELRAKLDEKGIDAALFLSPDEARAFVTLIQRDETAPPVAGLKTVAATPAIAAPLRALRGASVTVASASDPDSVWATLDGELIDKVEEERRARERQIKDEEARRRTEEERLRQEKEERERIAREAAEAERLARERAEAERQRLAKEEAERAELERLAREEERRIRAEEERRRKEDAERERAEKLAREKAEKERVAAERAAAEAAERERLRKEKEERERLRAAEQARVKAERERFAAEKAAREQAERERLAAERAERERLKAEEAARQNAERARVAAERAAADAAERERLRKEKEERERLRAEEEARRRLEKEQFAAERAEQERLRKEQEARERAERERLAAEQAAHERAAREQRAREKAARDEAERQRLAAERAAWEEAERTRRAAEKAERDRLEAERLERERIAREASEKQRVEKERLAREEAERVRAESARIAAEREKERLEQERLAREEAERRRAENARMAAEREKERLERERIAREEAERARAEKERLAREKTEAERLARQQRAEEERRERERRAEEERVEKERHAEAARLEKERIALEKAERDRVMAEQAAQQAERKRIALEEAAAQKTRDEQARREEAAKARAEQERLANERAEQRRLEKEEAAQAQAERKRLSEEQKARAKAEKARRAAERKESGGWFSNLFARPAAPAQESAPDPRWNMVISHDSPSEAPPVAVASAASSWNDTPMTDPARDTNENKIPAAEPTAVPSALQELDELVARESHDSTASGSLADAKPAARSGGGRSAQMLAEDAADERMRDRLANWGRGEPGEPAPPAQDAEPQPEPVLEPASAPPARRRGPGRSIALFFILATIATAAMMTSHRWLPLLVNEPPATVASAPAPQVKPAPPAAPPSTSAPVTTPAPNAPAPSAIQPAAAPPMGDASNQAIAALMARVATLEAALGSTARLDEINQRVESLAGRSADANSVLALADRVAALEQAGRRAADARAVAVALTIAATQWRDAVVTGRPFLKEWDTVKALNGQSQNDAAFAKYASTGLPTLAEMQRRFDITAAAAIRASYLPNDTAPWLRRTLDRVLSVITVRRTDVDTGDEVEPILVRAERAADGANLAGAVAELKKLTGAPLTAASPWIELAEARVAAEEAAQESVIAGATTLAQPAEAPAAAPAPKTE